MIISANHLLKLLTPHGVAAKTNEIDRQAHAPANRPHPTTCDVVEKLHVDAQLHEK